MEWLWRLGVLSNERAVANARAATTELSRQRVVRDDVELYLRDRYADLPAQRAYAALDAPAAEVAR